MSREKEFYRDNLELLLKAFPQKNVLNIADVAKWAGCDRRTAEKRYFPTEKKLITVAELARRIS
ncbi:hypothetical protein SDC9_141737 [bioreactor metagenome]|uniref:Uncharacterized protein n=1 Tax=bioreactor metagenome TaxID=1076179 RepID=A0A645DZ58_9ZZZZ